jgi:hypothetical protein
VLVVVTMGCPACELLGLALRRAVLRHHWHLTICAATAQECADYLGEVALPAGTPTLTIAELPCRLPGATPLVATVDRSGVVLDVVTRPTVRRITRSCAGDRAAGGSRLQEHGVVG